MLKFLKILLKINSLDFFSLGSANQEEFSVSICHALQIKQVSSFTRLSVLFIPQLLAKLALFYPLSVIVIVLFHLFPSFNQVFRRYG